MEITAKLLPGGQITIPVTIREALKLKGGEILVLDLKEVRTEKGVITKVNTSE